MPQRTARIDDALDGIFLHPIFGLAILAVLMFLIFQAVFSWATPIMDGIGAGIMALGTLTTQSLPDGALKSLLVDGIFSGLGRSEEHTSELQSLMRISYAVFCLKKKKINKQTSIKHIVCIKKRIKTNI